MAMSQLQKIAQGLRKVGVGAGRAADRVESSGRDLAKLRSRVSDRRLSAAVRSAGLSSRLASVESLLDQAVAQSRSTAQALAQVDEGSARWVGQLVAAGAKDDRVSPAQQRQMEKWAQRSGAEADAREKQQLEMVDAIFSPYASAAAALATAAFPPLLPLTSGFALLGTSKGMASLLLSGRDFLRARGRSRNDERVAVHGMDHAGADVLAGLAENAFQAFTGVDMTGAVGVSADVLHRVRAGLLRGRRTKPTAD